MPNSSPSRRHPRHMLRFQLEASTPATAARARLGRAAVMEGAEPCCGPRPGPLTANSNRATGHTSHLVPKMPGNNPQTTPIEGTSRRRLQKRHCPRSARSPSFPSLLSRRRVAGSSPVAPVGGCRVSRWFLRVGRARYGAEWPASTTRGPVLSAWAEYSGEKSRRLWCGGSLVPAKRCRAGRLRSATCRVVGRISWSSRR
jgi:hypothetical protein